MNYAKKISSPLGDLYLIANEQALISLENTGSSLFKSARSTQDHDILNLASIQIDEYFQKKRTVFDLPLHLDGTPFQKQVWASLMHIPFGKIWTYSEQAKFIKSPKAYRAVGGANGKNPIAIIIPCHRVIGASGKLTGYSGGMNMKIKLLKHEGHQIDGLQRIN